MFRTFTAGVRFDHIVMDSQNTHVQVSPHAMRWVRSALDNVIDLLDDPSCNELMINPNGGIFIERDGATQKIDRTIEQSKLSALRKAAQSIARDGAVPLITDSFLPGYRICIIPPEITNGGFALALRKHASRTYSLEEMVESETLTLEMADILRAIIGLGEGSIVLAGGVSTGKTTFLTMLSSLIPTSERVVILEDTREIQIERPNMVQLQVNVEAGVSMVNLVKTSLRLNPRRIIVGELRGEEAFDAMQAFSTGHGGGLTTIHANSAGAALLRLESLIRANRVAESMPTASIRVGMLEAFPYIVSLQKDRDGRRKVREILHVTALRDGEFLTKSLACADPRRANFSPAD